MNPPFESIQTDLKQIRQGDWFFPVLLKGEDQHFRIPEAAQLGAIGSYHEAHREVSEGLPAHFELKPVFDLRQTLFDLTQQKRAQLKTQMAVVAGSAGKTSVKDLVGAMLLQTNENSFFSPANQNTKIALATQILHLDPECEKAVFEVGARHPHDFDVPSAFLQPQIACLLNIGRAHLGEFGSEEILRETKLSILRGKSVNLKIIPRDDPSLFEKAKEGKIPFRSFGIHPESDFRLVEEKENRVLFWAEDLLHDFENKTSSPAFGLNLVAAVAVARALGLHWDQIQKGAENFRAPAGRFSRRQWQDKTIIDDAFNASPESMRIGIQSFFQQFSRTKNILVLGDILELGFNSESIHRSIGRELGCQFRPETPSTLVTVGAAARSIGLGSLGAGWPQALWTHVNDASEAQTFLTNIQNTWDVAYLKSSKAIGLHQLFSEQSPSQREIQKPH